MKCLMCDGKGYYKEYTSNTMYIFKSCDCDFITETIARAKKEIKISKEVDESKYVMDASMIMSIATLFLEMQDYDSMMEYASLLHGVDLGN